MTTIRDLALAIPCPYPPCGAGDGQECRTKAGHRAGYTHSLRLAAIQAARMDGFEEGIAEAVLTFQSRGGFTRWQLSIAEDTR